MGKRLEVAGQKFNKLTPLKRIEGTPRSRWLCRCDCGVEKEINQADFVSGNTKSCGCLNTFNINKSDISGQRFSRLVVIERTYVKNHISYWLCQCDCGNTSMVARNALLSGRTRSCGCLLKESTKLRFTTHGKWKSKVYKTWSSMMSRCYNKNNIHYHNYGGRGIIVASEWHTFENFYRDVGDPPSNKHSIDRIDVNGNYERNNIQWATWKQQQRNKRNSYFINISGKALLLAAVAEVIGVSVALLRSSLIRGWSVFDTLVIPPYSSRKEYYEVI